MQGLIFIPDITGFSNFVNSVNIDQGVCIIKALLNEIIVSNPLDLQLSEIEGDAILYYKPGKPIPKDELVAGCRAITKAFDNKYELLKKEYCIEVSLSLKFIIHYGCINLYEISGFKQILYGEAVIEAHRLLKNGQIASNYILMTRDYFTALDQTEADIRLNDNEPTHSCSDTYVGTRKVDYYMFNNCVNQIMENSLERA